MYKDNIFFKCYKGNNKDLNWYIECYNLFVWFINLYLGLYNFLSELNIEMNDCDCLNFGFLIVIYFMYFDMGIWLLISM